ncbi:MAG TPA: hypothetical protein VIV55_10085 [Flavobacterium sp.]
MTKISNRKAYSNEDPISENDFVVGTDGDSEKKATKSFSFWNIREFVNQGLSPETGGTLAITELVYVGALTTPEEVVNELVPNKTILAYEVFIVSINGDKYICSLQDAVVGDTQPPTTASDFISLTPKRFKVYTAVIKYNGTIWIPTVLENGIGAVVWSGDNSNPTATLVGAFVVNKTFTLTGSYHEESESSLTVVSRTADSIHYFDDNAMANNESFVEIRVYN